MWRCEINAVFGSMPDKSLLLQRRAASALSQHIVGIWAMDTYRDAVLKRPNSTHRGLQRSGTPLWTPTGVQGQPAHRKHPPPRTLQ